MWGAGFPLGAAVGYQMAAGALDPSLISVGSVAAAVGAGLVGECCIFFANEPARAIICTFLHRGGQTCALSVSLPGYSDSAGTVVAGCIAARKPAPKATPELIAAAGQKSIRLTDGRLVE